MSVPQTVTEYPVSKLGDPTVTDPVPNLLELIINGNGVSLTYGLNTLIAGVTGWDAIATITNYVSGDWGALQKSAGAIRNLAFYNDAYQQSVDSAISNFAQTWKGNAADNARTYFTKLGDALSDQIGPMLEMADKIDEFARLSYDLANGIAALVQYLGDLAIQWVVAEAAAIAAASSGIAAAAAPALKAVAAAIAAVMALQTVKAIGMFGNWFSAAQGLNGYLSLESADVVKIPKLPEKSYDHPGVS